MITTSEELRPDSLRVLVVDDGVLHQRLARTILTKQGHEVTVASDGRRAVDLVGREDFDVVLMDIEMPVMDGLTATCLIRERERTTGRRTPVVAVSSTTDSQRCLDAGMDAFIPKPLRAAILNETLQEVLT
jgi:two-component system, sensor histidine kinase and response regulator